MSSGEHCGGDCGESCKCRLRLPPVGRGISAKVIPSRRGLVLEVRYDPADCTREEATTYGLATYHLNPAQCTIVAIPEPAAEARPCCTQRILST
jgi:hypothetical protein